MLDGARRPMGRSVGYWRRRRNLRPFPLRRVRRGVGIVTWTPSHRCRATRRRRQARRPRLGILTSVRMRLSSAAAYTTPTLARRQQACFYEFFDRATARVRQFRGPLPAVTLAAKDPFFRGRALSGVTRCRGDNTSAIW